MPKLLVATFFGVSLTALAWTGSLHAQVACKSVDEMTPAGRASRVEAVRNATPEALTAFVELTTALRDRPGKIVGGHLTSIQDNPWQVALVRAVVAEPVRSQFCGGSIIQNEWVLTAAHCVRNSTVREDPKRVDIVVGTSQYAIGGERIKAAAIHTHPQYNQTTMDNDFALIRLEKPMTKGQTIQLADANTQLTDGLLACVSGWGATSEGGPGAIDLLGAQVPVVATNVCNQPASYNGDITAAMFCAGKEQGGVDSCQGDSGGPISASVGGRTTLIGVVSWGEGCARRLKYGVYARVPVAADWIATTTKSK